MHIYECQLELMENVLFVSTQFGNEYQAFGFIGNTTLPYALHFAPIAYRTHAKPMHRNHFAELTKHEIYITPATFLTDPSFKVERFNCQPDSYQLFWRTISKSKSEDDDDEEKKDGGQAKGRGSNHPDEGFFKLIKRGNVAVFYILSQTPLTIPQYIRVGKFMSKCKLTTNEVFANDVTGNVQTSIILRAEDIPNDVQLTKYIKTPIQHGMYLKNCEMNGNMIHITTDTLPNVYLPKKSAFYIAEA